MKKEEMMIEILYLYDENEALKRKNESLRRDFFSLNNEKKEETKFNVVENEALKIGKKKLLETIVYTWREVSCEYNKENNTYSITSLDKWMKESVAKDRLPDNVSYDEFVSYFCNELSQLYLEKKEKAIKKAKCEENEQTNNQRV